MGFFLKDALTGRGDTCGGLMGGGRAINGVGVGYNKSTKAYKVIKHCHEIKHYKTIMLL